MDKATRTLPHVRQRDNLQEHQARLAVPYARDHSACPGSSPSHLADRFIPCRAREEDQLAFDDFRSPKRLACARVSLLCWMEQGDKSTCFDCRLVWIAGAEPTVYSL